MKKEWVPLTEADREQLDMGNKIRIKLAFALPLFRIYLFGIGTAFAFIIGLSYFMGWSDRWGAVILFVIAILTYFIAQILWPNLLRNLDLIWDKKYRLETQEYEIKEGTDEWTVTIPGIAKPFIIHEEPANESGKKGTLLIEYTPLSKTILSVNQNPTF